MAASLRTAGFFSLAVAICYAELVITASVTTEREALNITVDESHFSETNVTEMANSNGSVAMTTPMESTPMESTAKNISSIESIDEKNNESESTMSSQSITENSTTATTAHLTTKLSTESKQHQLESMTAELSTEDDSTITPVTPETKTLPSSYEPLSVSTTEGLGKSTASPTANSSRSSIISLTSPGGYMAMTNATYTTDSTETNLTYTFEEPQPISTTERLDNSTHKPATTSPMSSSSRPPNTLSLTSTSVQLIATLKERSSPSLPLTSNVAQSSSANTFGTTSSSTTPTTTAHRAGVVTMTAKIVSDIRCSACENAHEACSCDDGSKIKPIYDVNGSRKEKHVSEDTLDPTGALLDLARPCFDTPLQYGVCSGHMLAWSFVGSNVCLEFVYSGCGTSENVFGTEKECHKKCGDKKGDNDYYETDDSDAYLI